MSQKTSFVCSLCGNEHETADGVPPASLDDRLGAVMRRHHPEARNDQLICPDCVARLRTEFIEDVLKAERGELSRIEQEVVRSVERHQLLSRDVNAEVNRRYTFGQRIAERLTSIAGSWPFIMAFVVALAAWIAVNASIGRPFDPFPFILLNLALSTLAALQAPVILMSQNLQAERDRIRGEHDYRVDLKAELEVRHLNMKMDQLLTHQWKRLLEIQKIQVEMMEELMRRRPQ